MRNNRRGNNRNNGRGNKSNNGRGNKRNNGVENEGERMLYCTRIRWRRNSTELVLEFVGRTQEIKLKSPEPVLGPQKRILHPHPIGPEPQHLENLLRRCSTAKFFRTSIHHFQ
jgi:hypothetical protein